MKTYTLPKNIVKDTAEELAYWQAEFDRLQDIPEDQVTEDDLKLAGYIGYRLAEMI